MYVCSKCGNYKSFTVSIPETVNNVLVRTKGGGFEEQLEFIKEDQIMQEVEETMVCNECESMGVVDIPSNYLDIELQNKLYHSISKGLDIELMGIMKKEAAKVGDQINPEDQGEEVL